MVKRLFIILIPLLLLNPSLSNAEENDNLHASRMELYKKTEAVTLVPWYYLAAWDAYERHIQQQADNLISITFTDSLWFGPANVINDSNETMFSLFSGIGKDGNGDGIANPDDPEDVLLTAAVFLQSTGNHPAAYHIQLWDFYMRDVAVQTIKNNAKIFQEMHTTQLDERAFPISTGYHYTYNNTWGHSRGYGGRRIHEGTDIFAPYGTPVQSTTYGIVELKGWNRFGGWRIGIRDTENIYHYYAHLNSYAKDIKIGDIVKPGDVIGTVGSSGYGPPGTAGKFPPHLHYGMYKDNGKNEWAFDPYPSLRRWEQQ